MKDKLLTLLTVLLIGALLLLLQSCKEKGADPSPDDQQVFKSKIARTWKVNRVTRDAVDVTLAFKSMTITFNTDQSYSVTNSLPPMWPASGTFEIVPSSNGQYDLKRNDGVVLTTSALTDSGLILDMTYVSPTARVAEVSGKYRFELGL